MSFAKRGYGPEDEPVPGYHLTEFLGKGQFGEVWKSVGPGGSEVALKIIDLTGHEGVRELAALQRVKSIHHPNLMPIFASWLKTDDGRIIEEGLTGAIASPTDSDTTKSISDTAVTGDQVSSAELIELIVAMGLGAKSLFERLQECRRRGQRGIPREELLSYMDDAAKGIDYLNQPIHDLGAGPVPIIHGDIKPHNLLVVGNSVQVCDFGLARAVESLRRTQTAIGTCAYAASELLYGKPHPASDQYCLAVSYVELRTGALPFHETNPFRVADLHKEGKLDLSKLLVPERDVIKKATALEPTSRWSSCCEMVRALRRACEAEEQGILVSKPPGQETKLGQAGSGMPAVSDLGQGTANAALPTDVVQGTLLPPLAELPEKVSTDEVSRAAETLPLAPSPTAVAPKRKSLAKRLAWAVLAICLVLGLAAGIDVISGSGVSQSLIAKLRDRASGESDRDLKALQAEIVDLARRHQFLEAVEKLNNASPRLGSSEQEQLREDIFRHWKTAFDELAAAGRTSDARKMLNDAPFGLMSSDQRASLSALVAGDGPPPRNIAELKVRIVSLAEQRRFSEAAEMLNSAPPELGTRERDDLRKEISRQWNGTFNALHQSQRIAEAQMLLDDAPPEIVSADQKLRLREVLLQLKWSGLVKETWEAIKQQIQQRRFVEALEKLKSVSPRLEKDQETELRTLIYQGWKDRFEEARGRDLAAALKMLAAAPPELVDKDKRKALHDDTRQAWKSAFAKLVKNGKFVPALSMLDAIPPELVDAGEDRQLRGQVLTAWSAQLESVWKTEQWEGVRDSCGNLLAHFPQRAEMKLLRARALVRLGEFQAAVADLDAVASYPAMPDHARPLHLALRIIAECSRQGIDPSDVSGVTGRLIELAEFDDTPQSGFWGLDSWENAKIGDIRDDVVRLRLQGIAKQAAQQPSAAQDTLALVDKLLGGADNAEARLWRAVIDAITCCRNEKAEPEKVVAALAALDDALLEGKWPLSLPVTQELCAALSQLAGKNRAASGRAAELDKAVEVVRAAGRRFPMEKEIGAALGRLWESKIALRIMQPAPSKKAELDGLEADMKLVAKTGQRSLLIDAWRTESAIVSGSGKAAPDLESSGADRVPANLTGYVPYVRALVLHAAAEPGWNDAAIAELVRALDDPAERPKVLTVGNRMERAVTMIVEAAKMRRQEVGPYVSLDGPPPNPFAEKSEYYALLGSAHRFAPAALDASQRRDLAISLALAAADGPKTDARLSRLLTAELLAATGADLGPDAAAVLYACVKGCTRQAAGEQLRPADRRSAVLACTRLLKLLRGDDRYSGTLTDEHAAVLYNDIIQPVRSLADALAAKDTSGVDEFYASAGHFIWDHRYADWPVPDKEETVETLFGRAIEIAGKQAAAARDKDRVAEYYVQRGLARVKRTTPNVEGAISDATAAADLADPFGAHGLLSHAYLLRARSRTKHADRISDYGRSIESGKAAAAKCPREDRARPNYLVNLSCAYLERANYERDPTGKKQSADLKLALQYAKSAAALKLKNPDFPYLALGNAYEDLAWLAHIDPENNFKEAIAAFREASKKKHFSAQALCSIGRCYYKAVAESHLKPEALGMRANSQVMAESKKCLEQAVVLDPQFIEAHFRLGLVGQYLGKFAEADKHFEKAMSLANERKLPNRVVYISHWAAFPLRNSSLQPDAQNSTALKRVELLRGVPVAPASAQDPAKEAARIRGDVHVRKGQMAEAMKVYSEALPKSLTSADVPLLLARAFCSLSQLIQRRDASIAEAAVRDADLAAELAVVRATRASALWWSAFARYRVYEIRNTEAFADLERSIDDMHRALAMTPSGPLAVQWRKEAVDRSIKTVASMDIEKSAKASLLNAKMCSAILKWQQERMALADKAAERKELKDELDKANALLENIKSGGIKYLLVKAQAAKDAARVTLSRDEKALLSTARSWQQERLDSAKAEVAETEKNRLAWLDFLAKKAQP